MGVNAPGMGTKRSRGLTCRKIMFDGDHDTDFVRISNQNVKFQEQTSYDVGRNTSGTTGGHTAIHLWLGYYYIVCVRIIYVYVCMKVNKKYFVYAIYEYCEYRYRR